MNLKENLIAHKGEKGLTEKMNAEYLAAQGVELTDDELTAVSAGLSGCDCPYPVAIYSDDRGDFVQEWTDGNSKYVRFLCPKCGHTLRKYLSGDLSGHFYCLSCEEIVDPTQMIEHRYH